jgi:hypothetical protein
VAFPDVPLRVEDHGGIVFAQGPEYLPPPEPGGFAVYCDVPLSETDAAALARAIDQLKPVHVPHRLRIRSTRRTTAPEP